MLSILFGRLSTRVDALITSLPFRLNGFYKSALKVFFLAVALSLPVILLVIFLVPHQGSGGGGLYLPRPPAAYEPLPPFDGTIDLGGESGQPNMTCSTEDVFASMWMHWRRPGGRDPLRDMYKFRPLMLDVEGDGAQEGGDDGDDKDHDGGDIGDRSRGNSEAESLDLDVQNDTDGIKRVQMVYFAVRLLIGRYPKSYRLWQFQEYPRNSRQNPIVPLSLDVIIPPSGRRSHSTDTDAGADAVANSEDLAPNAELVLSYLPSDTSDRQTAWRQPIHASDQDGLKEYAVGFGINVTGITAEVGGHGGEVRLWFEGEEQRLEGREIDMVREGEDGETGEAKDLRVPFFRRRWDEPGSGPYRAESVLFDSMHEALGFGATWEDVRRIIES